MVTFGGNFLFFLGKVIVFWGVHFHFRLASVYHIKPTKQILASLIITIVVNTIIMIIVTNLVFINRVMICVSQKLLSPPPDATMTIFQNL